MRHSGFSSAAAWNQVNPHSAVLHTLTNQAKPRCADGADGLEWLDQTTIYYVLRSVNNTGNNS